MHGMLVESANLLKLFVKGIQGVFGWTWPRKMLWAPMGCLIYFLFFGWWMGCANVCVCMSFHDAVGMVKKLGV